MKNGIEQKEAYYFIAYYLAKEIGDVASFLFSDMSNAITGEVIHADNGFSTVAV